MLRLTIVVIMPKKRAMTAMKIAPKNNSISLPYFPNLVANIALIAGNIAAIQVIMRSSVLWGHLLGFQVKAKSPNPNTHTFSTVGNIFQTIGVFVEEEEY
jgi:hypothetical protein